MKTLVGFSGKAKAGPLVVLMLLGLAFATPAAIPKAAALTVTSNCTTPSVPMGVMPTLNSTFTLTIIGASGQEVTFNQNTILSLAACWSYGGYVHHSVASAYGNYTGIPMLTLINLVGGMTSGETVTATSGTDNYQTTYTYNEVTAGTGWGSIYTTSAPTTAVTSPPAMYLVLAYLWNGNPISAYACKGVSTPCPNGPTSSGVGPLRTVTISSSASYLIGAGGPWNKGVATIQVNPPETAILQAAQAVKSVVGGGTVSTAVTYQPPSSTGVYEQVLFSTSSGGTVGYEVPAPAAGFVTYQLASASGALLGYTSVPLVGQAAYMAAYTSMGDVLTAVSTP